MAVSVDVSEYMDLQSRLKSAEPKVKRLLRKRLREAAKPLAEHTIKTGAQEMPQRGGLSALVQARGKASVALLGSSVALKLRDKYSLRAMEAGRLRHPVYGNRKKWVTQPVPANAFSRAFQSGAPEARATVAQAVTDIIEEITG